MSRSIDEVLQTLQALDTLAFIPPLDTPYSKYSTINYIASAVDIPTLRDIVAQRRQQLRTFDAILGRMKSIADEFSQTRELVESSMRMHEGFMSSPRRVPQDILREIFVQCLPNNRYPAPWPRDAPLLLTQVCKSWRELAFDIPSLWSSVSIIDLGQDSLEPRINLYHLYWLRNARRRPLSLEVNLCDIRDLSWIPTAIHFSQLYTNRCTELSISFDSTSGLNRLFMEVPLLQPLTLRGETGATKEHPISIIQPYPRLHTLIISTWTLKTLSFFNLEWANLTRLAVLFDSFFGVGRGNFLVPLLQTCPNLEHFILSPTIIHQTMQPISFTHPKLRILDVRHIHDHGHQPLLGILTLPNLRRFVVEGTQDANDAFADIFDSELLLDDCRTLDITLHASDDIYDDDLDSICTVFDPGWSDLTHVILDMGAGAEWSWMILEFCPNLESLTISMNSTSGEPPYTCERNHQLRSLILSVKHGGIGSYLTVLTLPELSHLEISGASSKWPHASFKAFFSRSQCPLKTLKIKTPSREIPLAQRVEITALVPTLQCFDVYDRTDCLQEAP